MAFQNIGEVGERHLHILWTSADPVTAEHMILMYAKNSLLNEWWDRVTVIIWGAAQKLAVENESVRFEMSNARDLGVEFSACASCAGNLGTAGALEADGVEVIRWGEKLSLLMQNGKHVLSL